MGNEKYVSTTFEVVRKRTQEKDFEFLDTLFEVYSRNCSFQGEQIEILHISKFEITFNQKEGKKSNNIIIF